MDRSFPVVGVGASAGGVEALEYLFKAMPAEPGMAFVIITHLAPKRESMLPEILARDTRMPVLVAEDDERLGEVLARGLREQGYVVDLVADGETAAAYLRFYQYEVAVLDCSRPVTAMPPAKAMKRWREQVAMARRKVAPKARVRPVRTMRTPHKSSAMPPRSNGRSQSPRQPYCCPRVSARRSRAS